MTTGATAGRWSTLLGIAVSAGILIVLARTIDWVVVVAEFGRIRWRYIPILVVLLLLLYWIRVWRWQRLLPNGSTLSGAKLFKAVSVGFLASFVLPLRAGEVIRPWVLSRWQPVPFSTALASVITERVFDLLGLLGLFSLCLLGTHELPAVIRHGAGVAAGLTVLALVLYIAWYLAPKCFTGCIERTVQFLFGRRSPGFTARLCRVVRDFARGLRGVARPVDLMAVLSLSLLLWLLTASWFHAALWAFGVSPAWWVGPMLTVTVSLAVAAPSAPGFIGTFQAGCVLALAGICGLPREFALAYSVAAHALQFAVVVPTGLIVLYTEGLSIRHLTTAEPERTPR